MNENKFYNILNNGLLNMLNKLRKNIHNMYNKKILNE